MDYYIKLSNDNNCIKIIFAGDWVVENLEKIIIDLNRINFCDKTCVVVDISKLRNIDVSGAYVLKKYIDDLKSKNIITQFIGETEKHKKIFELIQFNLQDLKFNLKSKKFYFFYIIGKSISNSINDIILFISFLGEIIVNLFNICIKSGRIRWNEILYEIENTGVYAIPIVSLVAILSGVVISYQGAAQLSKFGANIFIVDLIGLSIAREMSPLLTSIMVAGRSGSSYTARIGSMMLNDEIDALRIIGISPIELLVIPKFFAMIISLPLLIFIADIVGIGSGLFISHILLNLNFHTLIFRLKSTLSITSFLIGILKGPIFSIPIVFISCFRGFQVKNNSEELGLYTTMSVVNTIFFVIIIDALLSIVFQKLGI